MNHLVEMHYLLKARWIATACGSFSRAFSDSAKAVEALGADHNAATITTLVAMVAVLESALAAVGLDEAGCAQVYRHGKNIATAQPTAAPVPSAKA